MPDAAFPVRAYRSAPSFEHRAFFPHKHKEFEIALFLSGSGTYRTLDQTYDIVPGDVFVFGTDETHCITDITPPMVLINVKIEPRVLWDRSFGFPLADFLPLFLHRKYNRFDRNCGALQTVRTLIERIEAEYTADEPDRDTMLLGLLSELLVTMRRAENAPAAHAVSYREDVYERMAQAMTYIDAHFSEKLTLADVAAVASFAPTYFCAVFKKLNGLSAWEYIKLRRVEAAKKQLAAADLPVLDIALSSGFTTSAGFNRAFKECTGTTPAAYRASQRKKKQ